MDFDFLQFTKHNIQARTDNKFYQDFKRQIMCAISYIFVEFVQRLFSVDLCTSFRLIFTMKWIYALILSFETAY